MIRMRAPRRDRPGTRHASNQRGAHRLTTLIIAGSLALGGGLAMASPATAAPADPVVFADVNLEDVVNDELGQSPGDTITEAQAATITNLSASSAGITDLGGIEYLTGLDTLGLSYNNISDLSDLAGLTDLTILHLIGNNVTDLSDLAGLTNLTRLTMGDNNISDVSPLSGLTSLRQLYLPINELTDVSDLAGLTGLTTLSLNENHLTDLTDLSSLTNLTSVFLNNQQVEAPATVTGSATSNPVVDVAGDPVAVSSANAGFSFDAAANEWTFSSAGTKALTWSATVTVGTASDVTFSGEIAQEIEDAPPEPVRVVAQDPDVVQAVCDNGDVVDPQINLATTEGIEYSIEGEVTPGGTVTVRAGRAAPNQFVTVDPDSDWVGNSDFLFATLEITLDTVDCEAPAEPDVPSTDDTPDADGTLPDTGGPELMAGILAAALVTIGGLLVAAGRMRRTP